MKKEKIKKRDRFKSLKKVLVPAYIVPDFIKRIYGVHIMTDNGLFKLDKDRYNFILKITVDAKLRSDEQEKIFQILRGYDVSFRFCYMEQGIYMVIRIQAENVDEAASSMHTLTDDICKKLAVYNISVRLLSSDERMRTAHNMINKNMQMSDTYFGEQDMHKWKKDFELTAVKDATDYIILTPEIEKKKDITEYNRYRVLYLKSVNAGSIEFISEIRKLSQTKAVIIQTEPVSDQAAFCFYESVYMGYENNICDTQYKEPELYEFFQSDRKDNNRTFTLNGIMCLIKTDADVEEKISFLALRYDTEISYFHIRLKEIFKDFLMVGDFNTDITRCCLSSHSAKFIFPFDVQKEADDSIDALFLDMDELDIEDNKNVGKKSFDEIYGIDDYDEDDDETEELG